MNFTYSIVGAAVGALATGTVKGALKGATVGSAFKIAQDVVGSYRGGVAGLGKPGGKRVNPGPKTRGGSSSSGADWTPCDGSIYSLTPGSGGVYDPNLSFPGGVNGGYKIPFHGAMLGGACNNVDGQTCGIDSTFVKGVCTKLPEAALSPSISSGKESAMYIKWVSDYYTLLGAAVQEMAAENVQLEGGSKANAKWAAAMVKSFGKDRASMLAQIKSGKAPALLYKALNAHDADPNNYINDAGGVPFGSILMIARNGGAVPDSVNVVLQGDAAAQAGLKGAKNAVSKILHHSKSTTNPFPGAPAHQQFVQPTQTTPVASASANPTWTSPHDTIAAANATANADLQNAINTGNMLDSVLQAGSGVAYGGAVNSDNQITNQPAPPAGNMAPQVQPGSGSQFVPPPPPDYSHMTGLGDLRDADMSAIGNSLLNLALIGGFLFVASEGVKKIGKRKKRAARRDRWAY